MRSPLHLAFLLLFVTTGAQATCVERIDRWVQATIEDIDRNLIRARKADGVLDHFVPDGANIAGGVRRRWNPRKKKHESSLQLHASNGLVNLLPGKYRMAFIALKGVNSLAGTLMLVDHANERFALTLLSGSEYSEADNYWSNLDQLHTAVDTMCGASFRRYAGRAMVNNDLRLTLERIAQDGSACTPEGELVERQRFIEIVADRLVSDVRVETGQTGPVAW